MTTQLILNMPLAKEERDKGIKKAIDHANAVVPDWADKAFNMFREWVSKWPSGYLFMMEDFRKVSKILGLEDPPSERAFGGIAIKAKFAGIIKSHDRVQVKNKKAHACFATRWAKV